jgi:hypothetical protein
MVALMQGFHRSQTPFWNAIVCVIPLPIPSLPQEYEREMEFRGQQKGVPK